LKPVFFVVWQLFGELVGLRKPVSKKPKEKYMKTKPNAIQSVAKVIVALTRNHVLTVASAAVLASGSVQAANINKADNSDALNLTTSWTGSVVPTASDVAVWDSTVTSNNTTNTLGASTSWAGIQLLNPATALTVITNTGGNTLTLGAAGIDMSSATVDLTMSNNVTLAASTVQSWNVPSGRTLSLQGAFARPTGTLLSVNGSGTINIGAGSDL
jgi:hypothetical protein